MFRMISHASNMSLREQPFQITKTSNLSCTAALSTADSTLPLALSLHGECTGLVGSVNEGAQQEAAPQQGLVQAGAVLA